MKILTEILLYLLGYPVIVALVFFLIILFLAFCLSAVLILMPICIIASPFAFLIDGSLPNIKLFKS